MLQRLSKKCLTPWLFSYPGQQLFKNEIIFTKYKHFSVASLKDLSGVVQSCNSVRASKANVSLLSCSKSRKPNGKRLLHNAVAASSVASFGDAWNVVTLTYASVIAAGGVTGYVRTRSVPSLLSGVLSALLLFVSWYQNSPPLACAVSSALTVAFFMRYRKTKKMYPSGILGILSIGASAFFGYVSYWT